jgi:MFS family permease
VQWRYRDGVLALAALANFSQFGARLVISPLVPDIIAAFSVTKSTVGLALTGVWATFALFQYPSGVLADRYGERRVILTALGLTAGCSLLLALSPSFLAFAAFAVLLGAGAGLYFSVGTASRGSTRTAAGRSALTPPADRSRGW